MPQVQLIVNGDDFGITPEVNQAIIRACKRGALTSCSLMVSGMAFHDAVRLARENDRLAVGLHMVTVMGRSVLPHSEIPSLVDREGNFPTDPTAAGLKYYFSPKARRELRKELEAQFEKFASTGLPFSHIDSHLHMHVHPVIFNTAVELGERFGVRYMRVPRDALGLALRFNRQRIFSKALNALIFYLLTGSMRRKLKERGFSFPRRVYGHLLSGGMSEEYVLSVLKHLPPGKSEIYFHPALYTRVTPLSPELSQCLKEYEILVSEQVLGQIRELDIQLIGYTEMGQSS